MLLLVTQKLGGNCFSQNCTRYIHEVVLKTCMRMSLVGFVEVQVRTCFLSVVKPHARVLAISIPMSMTSSGVDDRLCSRALNIETKH